MNEIMNEKILHPHDPIIYWCALPFIFAVWNFIMVMILVSMTVCHMYSKLTGSEKRCVTVTPKQLAKSQRHISNSTTTTVG